MSQPYSKQHLTYSQQIALLESRGMIIPDKKHAESVLSCAGYYHMSAYWYRFRMNDPNVQGQKLDQFIPGTSFDTVERLMNFDTELRHLLLRLLTALEITTRTRTAYIVGAREPAGYMNEYCLDSEYQFSSAKKHRDYTKWLSKLMGKIDESKEAFMAHYRSKYSLPLPIWICCELWDFGQTSIFFQMLDRGFRDSIALSLGITNSSYLTNWLHSLNVIRNICAHNARLWNKAFSVVVQIPDNIVIPDLAFLSAKGYEAKKLGAALSIAVWLFRSSSGDAALINELRNHILTLPAIDNRLKYDEMGLKDDWMKESIWGPSGHITRHQNTKHVRTFNDSILKHWHYRK